MSTNLNGAEGNKKGLQSVIRMVIFIIKLPFHKQTAARDHADTGGKGTG